MKKRAYIFILLLPFIYLYSLAENHFDFKMTKRGHAYEFILEVYNALRVIIGKEYIDYSVKIANNEIKIKASKAKFDKEIALEFKQLFGRLNVKFKDKQLNYYNNGHYGDTHISIYKYNDDEYSFYYNDSTNWTNHENIKTDYKLTKDQVITLLHSIKNYKKR